jgi:hypothetical protein
LFEAIAIEFETSTHQGNATKSGSFESEKSLEAETVAPEKTANDGAAERSKSIDFKISIDVRLSAVAINVENDNVSDQKGH